MRGFEFNSDRFCCDLATSGDQPASHEKLGQILAGTEGSRHGLTIGLMKVAPVLLDVGHAIHQVPDRPSDDFNREMESCLHDMEISGTFRSPNLQTGPAR